MGRKPRVRMVSKGAVEVLTSEGTQDLIRTIVEQGAANANAMDGTPETGRGEKYGYEASVIERPRRRAGGRITALGPSARRRNAQNNTLLKAFNGVSI